MRKNADILIAWAQGKDVQYEYPDYDDWVTWRAESIPPPTYWECKWRIKPEPKPDVVRYANLGLSNNYSGVTVRARRANCSLTFSGETGELIKAEVLK